MCQFSFSGWSLSYDIVDETYSQMLQVIHDILLESVSDIYHCDIYHSDTVPLFFLLFLQDNVNGYLLLPMFKCLVVDIISYILHS